MVFNGHNTRVLVGVTAALLLIGTATFAATSPGGSRPRPSDLPVISLTRDLDATATTPAVAPAANGTARSNPQTTPADSPIAPTNPPTAHAPKTFRTPAASSANDDCEREVVSPPIRDEDPDEDADIGKPSPASESSDDQ